MYKVAKIIAIILGVIGFVLWIIIARADSNVVAEAGSSSNNIVGMMINLGYWLTIIVAIITLLFSLVGLASDANKLKKAAISLAVFAVVIVVSYVLASGTDVDLFRMANRGIHVTEGAVRWVGAGLWAFYILALLAILAMVIGAFKKQ